jgi:multidrug resistance efflux pump
MKPLPPIPTPPAQKWREFRIQILPLFVFCGAVALTILIWNYNLAAPTFAGEVEAVQANVISAQGGIISDIRVERYQRVAAGEVIAVVSTVEPERMQTALRIIETDLQVMRARLLQDQDRNELGYERLRLDHLAARTDLAMRKVQLQNLQREFDRVAQLFQNQLVSEETFESIRTAREAQEVEVEQKGNLVTRMEETIALLHRADSQMPALLAAVENSLRAQEEQLRFLEQIVAPISGTVSIIYRRPGEKLMAGEPVVTLSPDQASYIVGYAPQPVRVVPEPGMKVRVRTRSNAKAIGESEIYRVGSSMEEIAISLRAPGWETVPQKGLPFLVTLPPHFPARPGEKVDLIVLRR